MKVFPIYEALSLFNNTDRIYTPRIIYNKVIITPATWSIPYAVFEEGIKSVQCFFETWEIPQYVYLIKGDNKLLLCLNNSSHVELLFYIAHGRKTNIKITEAFVEDEKNWLKDCNGKSYQNELVLFLFKNEKRNKIEFNDLPSPLKQKTDVQDINGDTNSSFNTIFPGTDGWIYLLLYYNEEEFEYILGNRIKEFCEELQKSDKLEKYFYIQYYNPEKHIRLRLKYKTVNNIDIINLFAWVFKLKEDTLVFRYQLDTYHRESSRYGGINLIQLAETVFWKDSQLMEKYFSQKETMLQYMDETEFGILNMLSIMSDFGLSLQDMENWLSNRISKDNYRKEFRKSRNQIIHLMESFDNCEENGKYYMFSKIVDERSKAIIQYKEMVDLEDSRGCLTNTKENILTSIIHMSCNRFKGDNIWENKIYALTRNGIYAYLTKKKKMEPRYGCQE